MGRLLASQGRPVRVLLIDDNRGDAVLAAHAFKASLYETDLCHAYTGEEAIEKLHHGSELPDLILLDLGLPRMSGMDVLNEIKTDKRFKHIPVIVLSNSGDSYNVTKAYRQHANAYVIKPADLAHYRETIGMIEQFYFVLSSLPAVSLYQEKS